MTPTREIYWNISNVWLMYVLLIPTLIIFGYGLYRRYRLWRLGMPEMRFDRPGQRMKGLLVYALGQARLLGNPYARIFHTFLFSGFVILFIATILGFAIMFIVTLVVMVREDLDFRIREWNFYFYLQSLTLDVFGLLSILGVVVAIYHRYVLKPERLHSTWGDAVLLVSILTILLTGFMVEGLRIGAVGDPWAEWSPVGT
ncbi:MAG: (Fe-S)-binding protein, partial [Candidatus Binatia bacterium]